MQCIRLIFVKYAHKNVDYHKKSLPGGPCHLAKAFGTTEKVPTSFETGWVLFSLWLQKN